MAKRPGRRGNHDGSISERKHGSKNARFHVQVTMPDGSRKSAYASTKAEAQEKLKALQAEAERVGRFGLDTSYDTLGDFLAAWLDVIKATRRPNTYVFYRRIVALYCQELMPIPPLRLTPHHVQKLLTVRLADGLSATTVRSVHTTIHAALEFGVKQGILIMNAADGVNRPRKRKYEHKTFTKEQVRALLDATAEHRLAALFVLAVSTGLRPGEILGLRWQDVDFTTGEISIQRNVQRVDGVVQSEEPKSSSGHRSIKLTTRAYNALMEHQHRQDEEKDILENQWDRSWDLVFCTLKGTPIHETWLAQHVYKRALRDAGLPTIRFYDLRHTAATLLMEAGVHPKVVSEILGHSSITMTLDTYSHVLPHMHAEAMQKMGDILGDPGVIPTPEKRAKNA